MRQLATLIHGQYVGTSDSSVGWLISNFRSSVECVTMNVTNIYCNPWSICWYFRSSCDWLIGNCSSSVESVTMKLTKIYVSVLENGPTLNCSMLSVLPLNFSLRLWRSLGPCSDKFTVKEPSTCALWSMLDSSHLRAWRKEDGCCV